MKKYLLILASVLQMSFAFGQQDCIQETKTGIKRCWGAWRDFNGVQVSIRGPYNEGFNMINDDRNRNSYRWEFRFRPTNPSKAYVFKLSASDNSGRNNFFGGVAFPCNVQKPNVSNTYFRTFSNAEIINVNVSEVLEMVAQTGNSTGSFGISMDCNGKGWHTKSTLSKNETVANSSNPVQNQQVQQQSTTATVPQTATTNAVNNNISQQAINTQNQIDAINTIGGIASNAATSVAQKGLANLMQNAEIEAQVKQILVGRESQYPEAAQYFNLYLKEKKRASRGVWIGTGIAGAGAILAGIGALSGGEYDINEPLVYAGAGAAVVGLIKVLISLPVSKKGTEALQNAKRSLTFGTATSGVGVSMKF